MSETMTLEPCPFCGSGNVVHVTADHPKHAHYVLCMMCDSPSAMRDTPEHAAESWNKRTERDALRAEVERLREIEHDAVRMAWLIVNECGGRVTVKPRDVAAWRPTDILSRYPDMDGSVTFVAKHARPNDPEPPAERGEG